MNSSKENFSRRGFLQGLTASTVTASFLTSVHGQTKVPAVLDDANTCRDYGKNAAPVRYPDPDLKVLDDRFKKYMLGNTPIQRIYTGNFWAEGPAWNGSGRYLVWSDIPSDEQLRFIEEDNHVSRRFRSPSGNSNGNTFDYHGRQISCRHKERDVIRYEHNGSVTVLAKNFNGKQFNAPNDAVVHPNGDIWFTDPGYGSLMDYEGINAGNGSTQPFQKEAVYRIEEKTGKINQVTDEIFKPNGLCFSPDYKKLYVADTGASHYKEASKEIKVWDIKNERSLSGGKRFASMELDGRAGFADGIRADVDGNIWASAGWVGEGYDGVHVFGVEDGKRIGQITLPEICSNVCFGGTKRNRLFMTASQSVYAVYVNVKGAHIS
ncbi:MAG: SMP-30/gluconolactonase/LRE family protein [Lentisphaeraceae bacterium]|nr:SMP-30/gluconolactonase/LRE family protein [Lentisphaeraceae bacterium]